MAKGYAKRDSFKKGLIKEKAASLFKERGYAATSMRDLAEAVGMEASSLYNHIQSKSEILQEICFEVANDFTKQLEEAEHSMKPASEKIESIIRFNINSFLDHYEKVYAATHEWKHLEEPYRDNFFQQRKNYRKRMAVIIQEGIQRNEFRQQIPRIAVFVILTAITGIEAWHRNKGGIEHNDLVENMVALLLNSLKK
jgi:TetR/AcrR family transcriptional regulator, cholesterol catabolism regulator